MELIENHALLNSELVSITPEIYDTHPPPAIHVLAPHIGSTLTGFTLL
jgi:hypothetical protein